MPLEDTFNIEWDGQGFVISPYGSTSCIAIQNTSNTNLTTVPKTQDSKLRWSLSQYTGNHQSCSIIFFPSSWSSVGIVNGAEDEATLVGWSTHIDANTIDIEVKDGYSSLGEISEWNPSNGKLTLKALNPGKILLEQTTLYSDGTVVYSADYYFIIVPQEGTYYIRNVGTKRYIDLESASSSIGANIQQWQFHTESQEKWVVEHVPGQGGYVRLKSVCSNLYIGIDSNNYSLVKQYNANDCSLWMIDRSNNGNLIFTNKLTFDNGSVLSVPSNEISNGIDVINVNYINDDNYCDEWLLLSTDGSITIELQEQTQWCWVACAKMLSERYIDVPVSQATIATYVKLGIDTDEPTEGQVALSNRTATLSETETAVEYILQGDVCYSSYGFIYREDILQELLDGSNPIIILRVRYEDGKALSGHYTVIVDYKYDEIRDTYMYTIYDPNHKWKIQNSYIKICTGKNEYSNEIADDFVWVGVVVFKNGNYNRTISATLP